MTAQPPAAPEGTAPVEGVVTTGEPKCLRHGSGYQYHGFSTGAPPAHTYDVGPLPNYTPPGCLRCGGQFQVGDRYLCDDRGIVHVTCPQPPAAPETDARLTEAEQVMLVHAGNFLDKQIATVERIVAERVRVVEGERDAAEASQRETWKYVCEIAQAIGIDPDDVHPMDAFDRLVARAESAEAAHTALVAELEALADAAEARERASLGRTFDGGTFGAWVSADALRALLAGGAR